MLPSQRDQKGRSFACYFLWLHPVVGVNIRGIVKEQTEHPSKNILQAFGLETSQRRHSKQQI